MKLKCVTLTGADDKTSIPDMVALSKTYPFVEWAILFHPSKSNKERYPSWKWVVDLMHQESLNLSAHLCGEYVNRTINGHFSFLCKDTDRFNRFQFNMAKGRLTEVLGFGPEHSLWRAIKSAREWDTKAKVAPFIFGGAYTVAAPVELFRQHGIQALFDTSGGRGKLTKTWPKSINGVICGYAGGLGPDNIKEELKRIEQVVGDSTIWIDMESRVRTNGEFDLKLFQRVLEATADYVART